jgi:hypothetical protein
MLRIDACNLFPIFSPFSKPYLFYHYYNGYVIAKEPKSGIYFIKKQARKTSWLVL